MSLLCGDLPLSPLWVISGHRSASEQYRFAFNSRSQSKTLIDGIDKSASCHECDGASDVTMCIRADFAILRNCMADNRLTHPTVRR
jgi:hypothetical protein